MNVLFAFLALCMVSNVFALVPAPPDMPDNGNLYDPNQAYSNQAKIMSNTPYFSRYQNNYLPKNNPVNTPLTQDPKKIVVPNTLQRKDMKSPPKTTKLNSVK